MKRIQNKKKYYLALLSLIGGISFLGFSNKKMADKEKISYLAINENDIDGKKDTISYEVLSNLHVLFLSKNNDIFLAIKENERYYDYFLRSEIKYYDIFTNNSICMDCNMNLFLFKYNIIQGNYSSNDVKKNLGRIKNDYEIGYAKNNGYSLKLIKEEK